MTVPIKRKARRSGITPLRIRLRGRSKRVDKSTGQIYTSGTYAIGVPKIILLDIDVDEARFLPELTPEGDLLYRRVDVDRGDVAPAPFDLP